MNEISMRLFAQINFIAIILPITVLIGGKVSESNIPYLLTEINTALELALENRSWRDYFELARLQSDVSSYDSFEFIGEP